MTLPSLTIITPSLNQGRYLERALRSVLDQGYDRLEYIVMDGGSTDESVSILERYSGRLAYWVSDPTRVNRPQSTGGSYARQARSSRISTATTSTSRVHLQPRFPCSMTRTSRGLRAGVDTKRATGLWKHTGAPSSRGASVRAGSGTPGTCLRRRRSGGGEYSRSTDSCGGSSTTFSRPSLASALRSAACCRESATLTLPCVFFTARRRAPTPTVPARVRAGRCRAPFDATAPRASGRCRTQATRQTPPGAVAAEGPIPAAAATGPSGSSRSMARRPLCTTRPGVADRVGGRSKNPTDVSPIIRR